MFSVLAHEPFHIFVIPVKSDDFDEDSEKGIFCNLRFEYTPNYPDESPIILIEDTVRLDEEDEEALNQHLIDQVNHSTRTLSNALRT